MKILKRGLGLISFGVSLLLPLACLWLYVPESRGCLIDLYATVSGYLPEEWRTKIADGVDLAEETGITGELPQTGGEGTPVDSGELSGLEDSGITGDDYVVDTDKYPYYSLLTDVGQQVYRQICANIEALETTFVPTMEVGVSDVEEAMEAVFDDHPEYFWLETGYGYQYTEQEICVQIILYFNSTSEDIESARLLFDAVCDEVISAAQSLDSDYEKEKYVHDAILQLAEYDESVSASLSQSAYSALVMGKTVCAGYARAFQYIMLELGVPTYYVTGYASADHAWNIVMLSDGWYNVDLTWDDSVTVAYTYFNVPDSVFNSTHTRTGLSTQLPACTATEYYNPQTSQDAGQVPERFQPQENSQSVPQPEAEETPQPGNTSQGTEPGGLSQPGSSQPGTPPGEG